MGIISGGQIWQHWSNLPGVRYPLFCKILHMYDQKTL